METAIKLDIEKVTYELRCMMIRSEDLEKDRKRTQEHINKHGMTAETELSLAKLELLIERHELDKKEKRMDLMFLYKKSLKNVKQG
jgi:hypothetical protein